MKWGRGWGVAAVEERWREGGPDLERGTTAWGSRVFSLETGQQILSDVKDSPAQV